MLDSVTEDAVLADSLLQESVEIQRAFSGLLSAHRLYTVALAELQRLATDLPPGLSDMIPIELKPQQRETVIGIYRELVAARDAANPDVNDLLSVLGSFVLPWLRDTGIRARIEESKESRYAHVAAWQKRAATPIKLPFRFSLDDKRGFLYPRGKPLLFVASTELKPRLSRWLHKSLKKENKSNKVLAFSVPGFDGDVSSDVWAGKLHRRAAVEALMANHESQATADVPDIVFVPDLFYSEVGMEGLSLVSRVNESKRWLAHWAKSWNSLLVSCLYLDDAESAIVDGRAARLDLLNSYYSVVPVLRSENGVKIGRYSGDISI
jgi:hypothetical protein